MGYQFKERGILGATQFKPKQTIFGLDPFKTCQAFVTRVPQGLGHVQTNIRNQTQMFRTT